MSPVQTYKCHLGRVGHSICVPGSHPTTSAPPDRGFRYLGVARWPPPRRTSARPPGSPLTRPSPTPASASGSILNLQLFFEENFFSAYFTFTGPQELLMEVLLHLHLPPALLPLLHHQNLQVNWQHSF